MALRVLCQQDGANNSFTIDDDLVEIIDTALTVRGAHA
jgi:hypothetical protein